MRNNDLFLFSKDKFITYNEEDLIDIINSTKDIDNIYIGYRIYNNYFVDDIKAANILKNIVNNNIFLTKDNKLSIKLAERDHSQIPDCNIYQMYKNYYRDQEDAKKDSKQNDTFIRDEYYWFNESFSKETYAATFIGNIPIYFYIYIKQFTNNTNTKIDTVVTIYQVNSNGIPINLYLMKLFENMSIKDLEDELLDGYIQIENFKWILINNKYIKDFEEFKNLLKNNK